MSTPHEHHFRAPLMSTIRVQVAELEGQLDERADVEALLVGELERVTGCPLLSVAAPVSQWLSLSLAFPGCDSHSLINE